MNADANPEAPERRVHWRRWLAVTFVLLLLGGWIEHERAKASLVRFKKELTARGVKLTLEELYPPESRSASNGAAAFRLHGKPLRTFNEGPNRYVRPSLQTMVSPGVARVSWQQQALAKLDGDQRFIADVWPFYSIELDEQRPHLTNIHAAIAAPRLHFAGLYTNGFMVPYEEMSEVRAAAWNLSAAMSHDLHFGRTNEAWEHLRAAVRIPAAWQDGHLLISVLVYSAVVNIAASATWEALEYPGWSDAQLAELQRVWTSIDVPATVERGLAGELAWSTAVVSQVRRDGQLRRELGFSSGLARITKWEWWEEFIEEPGEKSKNVAFCIVWPLWTSYGDEQYCLGLRTVQLEAWRSARARHSLVAATRGFEEAARLAENASQWHQWSRLGELGNTSLRVANAAVFCDEVISAIALRRYQMRNGRFPERLEQLVPEFLPAVPLDFMDGQPLRYRLQPDGRFLLWSVGVDGVDDGGNPEPGPELTGSTWRRPGFSSWGGSPPRDIVWPRPASHEEIEKYNADLAAKAKAKKM